MPSTLKAALVAKKTKYFKIFIRIGILKSQKLRE
jgi:hypothetical protein